MQSFSLHHRCQLVMWYMANYEGTEKMSVQHLAMVLDQPPSSIQAVFNGPYRHVFKNKYGSRLSGKALADEEAWPDDESFNLEPPFPEWAAPTLYKALPHLKPKEEGEEKKLKYEHFMEGLTLLGTNTLTEILTTVARYNRKDSSTIKRYFDSLNAYQTAIILLKAGRSPYFETKLKEYIEGEVSEPLLERLNEIRRGVRTND